MIAGCMCTTIEDQYSVADPGKSGALRYEKVDDLDSLVNYSADMIPVVVHKNEGQEKKDALGGLHGVAWLCTVGLFPAWDTYERTWEVEVKTPVGVKSGVCTRKRREYLGWIPYMLPFAASDSEQNAEPSGELVRRVVGQFKSEWTTEKVAALNCAEEKRIVAQRECADKLLSAKDWNAVVKLCAGEKDSRFVDEYMRNGLHPEFETRYKATGKVFFCQGKETNDETDQQKVWRQGDDACSSQDSFNQPEEGISRIIQTGLWILQSRQGSRA